MNEIDTFLFIPNRHQLMDRDTKMKVLKRLLYVLIHHDEPIEDRTHIIWGLETILADVEMEGH